MENVDPVGIHTGESVVVAPSQTLNDFEYNTLRTVAIKVARSFGIIGECNIQYAVCPDRFEYYIIEVNARLSRSSALASKATGYPLAYVATRLALDEALPKIKNSVTGNTTACFEPSMDYCVVKVPRWDLCKFARVSNKIGSVMKSVGEAMGIGRSFEEAFQKALRMTSDGAVGFYPSAFPRVPVTEDFTQPTDKRIFAIARGLYHGLHDPSFPLRGAAKIQELTGIDLWFLKHMEAIIETHRKLESYTCNGLPEALLYEAKQCGFSDRQISRVIKNEKLELNVRRKRKKLGILPCVKQIDTVSAEWPAATNYLYLTYNGSCDDVAFNNKNGVIVLGSGVYRIGSSVEFDACCVGCVDELKALGYSPIMINCNPETVSTDYDTCNRLYFEEISTEVVCDVYERERPKGAILAFGGQAPNNIAMSLREVCQDLRIFGTSPDDIDVAENRFKFSRHLDELLILQPQWTRTDSIEEAEQFCNEVGYPCLIRPSYVLSGAAMNVAHNGDDLRTFLSHATIVAKDNPVVVSKFINKAKEIDVDGVAFEGTLLALAVCEHVENAGIHSGDATLVTPPQDINKITLDKIDMIARQLAKALNVNGPFNIQLIAKDNELMVIECNLRASRSLPFVTKTLDFDFVALATRCMMASDKRAFCSFLKPVDVLAGVGRVGVKVPQFSFARIEGADAMLGVEMVSTGEVGCFGKNHYEAYLKGLLSTGFIMPNSKIFLSIGGYHAKAEMLDSVRTLHAMNFELLASRGTADYFLSNNIPVKTLEWPFEEETASTNEKTAAVSESVADLFANRGIDLMINLPIRASGAYRVSAYRTHGYRTRRMAIDNGIPLITDIKCAKLFIKALRLMGPHPPLNSQIDCLSSVTVCRLPGFIDTHVHTRDPGHEHKETWETVTRAALAGGITMILAMPNTNPPLTDAKTFDFIEKIASSEAFVDYALFAAGTAGNSNDVVALAPRCAALKLYLDETFGRMTIVSIDDWKKHFESFPKDRPIVCHAEQRTLMAVLAMCQLTGRPVHIAHVSTAVEIEMIREAKRQGWPVTCEVCPHHLFLSCEDPFLTGGYEEVRPRLATSADVKALWDNIDFIDCFASDHAPHTASEKVTQKVPGFPSIEYMLPLLLNAVYEGRLTMEQLVDRLYHNPKQIFNLPEQKNTYIEVDLEEEWTIPDTGGQSRAGWTPYGRKNLRGRVKTVVLRGEEAYVDGDIVIPKGYGYNIRLMKEAKPLQYIGDAGALSIEISEKLPDDTILYGGLTPSLKSAEERHVSSAKTPPFDELFKQRAFFTSVDGMTKDMCSVVFDLAAKYKRDVSKLLPLDNILRGRVMALMFYEASTRTASSFASAMQRLGGTVVYFDPKKSSAQKGETLEDTIKIMCGYADVLVMRHPEEGTVARAAAVSRKPIVNAGDGIGQHPTQALLDVFTIREEIGTVNNITIAMVGDLRNGRTVHSLARLLCVYSGITLHYVIPTDELAMPGPVCDYVARRGFKQKVFKNLREGISGVDVIYMTRIQRERFASQKEYERLKGDFILTPSLLGAVTHPVGATCKGRERQLPIVMHPLPRVDEISPELDGDEQAAYFRQAENGVYVRMAVLSLILNGTTRI
uniref:CAD protein n=1 Tax=Parascaris univalens TaxID=6257 RepID=A0A915AC65_PARUN